MRVLAVALTCILLLIRPVWADPAEAARLWQVMDMEGVLAVMREEGLAYGRDLDTDMLDGQGGASFAARVRSIYDDPAGVEATRAAFVEALSEAETGPMLAFFESPLGQQVVTLEISARRAMLDPDVEAAARSASAEMRVTGGPRYELLGRFIATNNLVEENVAGAMNSSLAFSTGLNEGGGLPQVMSDDDLLADVWSREPEIRGQTEDWVWSFAGLAYQPLSDDDLAAYTNFSATGPGQALNQAIFTAFDGLFVAISRQLGEAVARAAEGQDL